MSFFSWPIVLLLLLGVLRGCGGVVNHIRPSARVILGQSVDHSTIPFYCKLFVEFPDDSGTSVCGCVLIKGEKAITAAHCLTRGDGNVHQFASAAFVRFYGDMAKTDDELTRLDLSRARIPSSFRYDDLYHDIAVMYVPGAHQVDGVSDIALNSHRSAWDALTSWDPLRVVGVGLDRNDALSLGMPRVAHLSRRSCSNPIGYGDLLPWISAHHDDICAGPFDPCDADSRCADSCRGDSGGPLYAVQSNGTITVFGLVSRGMQDCGVTGNFNGRPGIYAALDLHIDFIGEQIVQKSLSSKHNDRIFMIALWFLSTLLYQDVY